MGARLAAGSAAGGRWQGWQAMAFLAQGTEDEVREAAKPWALRDGGCGEAPADRGPCPPSLEVFVGGVSV